jgi:3-phenylpropionate/trans-cinnamate dioxygenase ferredoxin reductase subunit
MRKVVSIAYNGQTFSAYPGDVVLDSALLNGIGLPHDCRTTAARAAAVPAWCGWCRAACSAARRASRA